MKRAVLGVAPILFAWSSGQSLAGGNHGPKAPTGTFISASFGGSVTTEQDLDDTALGKGTYTPDFGVGGLIEIGQHLGAGWRMGVELGWTRGFDGEQDVFALNQKYNLEGYSDVYIALLNVYYTVGQLDTPLGQIAPFVGAGIGVAYYDVSNFSGSGPGDKTDATFAGALHFGYELALSPTMAFTARYSIGYTGTAEFGLARDEITTKQSEVDILGYTGLRFDLN